ncbi:hypothetical protein SCLCIDRAFT_22724 [Scleroderma citrinum Foug A]|uniref:Uncharacterized protein n=1 Tax=Scleroderma citrinum Foug A TaxID=1036808 RepID=A0A0C3AKU0_9AGAM|nr:hypothetical protein SCLCIDRAFT_22724 [Scleroderma citrinum Foug A]
MHACIRYDLGPSVSPSMSNVSVSTLWMFQRVSGWLRCAGAFQVSHFDFLGLADIYRCDFDSSAPTAPCDKSVQTFCRMDGWPRQHCQQHLLYLIHVDVAAAHCAIYTVSLSVLIAVASPLTLNVTCTSTGAFHGMLGCPVFGFMQRFFIVPDTVHIRAYARCIHSVAESIWLVWKLFYSTDRSTRVCFNAQGIRLPGQRICSVSKAYVQYSTAVQVLQFN